MKRWLAILLLLSIGADASANIARGKGKAKPGIFRRKTGWPPLTNTYSTNFVRTSQQYLTCGDPVTGGSANVTWSYWIKPSTAWPTTNPWEVWNKAGDGATYEWFFRVKENVSGTLVANIPSTGVNDATTKWTSAANVITLSVWNHVVYVFDGAGGTNAAKLKTYVNGSEITSGGTFTGTMPTALVNNAVNFRFSSWAGTAQNYYNGQIDEPAIWAARSLSGAEVTEIYNLGHPSELRGLSFSPPTHWWRMGDGDTTTVQDVLGGMNCTKSGNAPTFVADVP